MSLLLQPEWITQASDFIAQNWTRLLGIVGGTGGIVAIITLIGKIIVVCIQGHIARKNGKPIQSMFDEIISQIENRINELKIWVQEQGNELEGKLRDNLMQEINKTFEKTQKIKLSMYDKFVSEETAAKDALKELDESVNKVESYLSTQNKKDRLPSPPPSSETNSDESTIVETPKKKKVKIIVER